MRIRTQLFLGTAILVFALVGTGWWLQIRQIRALERELSEVAVSVGAHLLQDDGPPGSFQVQTIEDAPAEGNSSFFVWNTSGESTPALRPPPAITTKRVFVHSAEPPAAGLPLLGEPMPAATVSHFQHFELRVEATAADSAERVLVIKGLTGQERRVPIPIAESSRIVGATLQQGLVASVLLLLAGLAAAALAAHRMSAPLRGLARGAEALGQGELGRQVEGDARGELGELLSAFNRMSARLAQLEAEKSAWRAREHLAELGDLARGLGHTLRNPLHTLGLAVQELSARAGADGEDLAGTARGQIRRIDRWLRSFLSLGAGRSAEPERIDLEDLARDVALEAVQQGAEIELQAASEALPVLAVAPALRAALANLVDNALEASPAGAPVRLALARDGSSAVLSVADEGPGLPPEVRSRLFSPHLTTKAEGSGMGLFLAKQLIEAGHRGTLEISDRAGGGTLASIRLPLALAEEP